MPLFQQRRRVFSYSFIRAGLRIRFKRSNPPDNLSVEEAGNLLPEEIPYHAFSRILTIEPCCPMTCSVP